MRHTGIVVTLAAACGLSAQQSRGIVFRSNRGGGADGLYAMRADGTNVRKLVANDRAVLHFAVHPSGDRIAYVCDPADDEMFRLLVLDVQAGTETEVHHGIRLAPTWSPDGTRLAFMRHGQKWHIHLTNPALVVQRPQQDRVGGDGAPSWFPDGTRLAFHSNRTGALELFTADCATGKATRLTDSARPESSPAVSPDGRWIAYRSVGDLGVVRTDGSGARLLTQSAERLGRFGWSPDATRIVFAQRVDGNSDIFTTTLAMHASPVRLTTHAAEDSSPTWSPDGQQIAFVSERDGNEEIYVMRPDGRDIARITDDPGRDRSPAWQPARDRRDGRRSK